MRRPAAEQADWLLLVLQEIYKLVSDQRGVYVEDKFQKEETEEPKQAEKQK
jgi:hypothetical protein